MSPLILISCFVLLLVTGRTVARDGDLVTVGYYSESLCPDCIAMTKGPMNDAVTKVCLARTAAYIKCYSIHSVHGRHIILHVVCGTMYC